MNALRIRRTLKAPIPELPELTPLLGKKIEIIVLEDVDPTISASDFGETAVSSPLTDGKRVGPVGSLDELKGEGIGDALDGFEEAVDRWRAEPWMSPEK